MIVTLMTGLTILFVVYILYIVFTTLRTGCGDQEAAESAEFESSAKTGVETESKPESRPAAEKEAAEPSAGEITHVKQLRHPDTGETAAVPTNYRFAKRWIKEAIVKEGLLDRIYKNNELQDEATNMKVREALEKFKGMQKYWA